MFVVGASRACVDVMFGPNFMRCLINHVSSGDRFLHKAAKKSVSSIMTVLNLVNGDSYSLRIKQRKNILGVEKSY